MSGTLREINQQAIQEGLILPPGQTSRTEKENDYTGSLGMELTSTERRCYLAIVNNILNGPVTVETIYKTLFHVMNNNKVTANDRNLILVTISRIRSKLGDTEIITLPTLGYQSRRALIESSVLTRNRT